MRQMVGSDAVDRFAEFGRVLGMLENCRANISETDLARGAFEQAHAELVFQIGHAAAHGGSWHFEAARRFGEAISFDNLRENHQRIQVRHRYPAAPSSRGHTM